MALITCPNCGKEVSDTNCKCFHCCYDFITQKEKPQKLPDYGAFTLSEQEKLRKEFYSTNSKYERYIKKTVKLIKLINITYVLSILFTLSFITFSITAKIVRFEFTESMAIIILIVVGFWIITITSNVILRKVPFRKYRKKELLIEKKFQKWLKEEKNVNYVVPFTKKQKKDKAFFDSINVEKDDIEV